MRENINPKDIETILLQRPYIEAAAIVPKIDAQKGEYAHAVILPSYVKIAESEKKHGIRMKNDDLRSFILAEIKAVTKHHAFYKSPGGIEIVKDQKALKRRHEAWGERFMFGCHYMDVSEEVQPDKKSIPPDVSSKIFLNCFTPEKWKGFWSTK